MAGPNKKLSDSFEIFGRWWLPDQADEKIAGKLVFNGKEDCTLTLFGKFGGLPPGQQIGLGADFRAEIILGVSEGGDFITLLYATQSGLSLKSAEGLGIIQSFWIRYILWGVNHFSKLDEVLFDSFHFSISNLESWVAINPFNHSIKLDENKHFVGIDARYVSPEIKEFAVPSLDCKVTVTHTSKTGGSNLRSFTINHDSFLKIVPKLQKKLDWYLEVSRDLNNLINLLVGKPSSILRIIGNIKYIDEKGKERNKEVEVYYCPVVEPTDSNIHPVEVLFPLPRIDADFPDIVNAWFSQSDKLRSVYDLYFGVLQQKGMYAHLHFLTLMQAIESFHRNSKSGKYMDDDSYKILEKEMVAALPKEMPDAIRISMKSKIKYGNEFSLRKRMNDIFNDIGEKLTALVCKDKEYFINKGVNTRNYYTHWTKELEAEAITDFVALVHFNQRLKILLAILLIKAINIGSSGFQVAKGFMLRAPQWK